MSVENQPSPTAIDKVRASRDGHTYHETWAARVALGLLYPSTTLRAITVEGFFLEDEPSLSDAATEIADLVRYRGTTEIASATAVEVLQFKYSIARHDVEMRAFDIKKTLQKFAKTESDFIAQVGIDRVEAVVRYEIVTNRPFSPALIAAVEGLSQGQSLQGDAADQAKYINEALSEVSGRLPSLLKRIALNGTQGTLTEARALVRRTLADWSTPNDPLTRLRLANLRDLVHEKAGSKGQYNNLIDRVAVLACLEVGDERDLFPTPDAFPPVLKVIERPAIDELVAKIKEGGDPLLVDAPGGMGKTVLMQSLAQRLSGDNAVVLFDCYGGGSWRDPADGRQLPEKALPHIANLLAVSGLCDILIPGPAGPDLVRAFRRRLEHAVKSLRNTNRSASVFLLLDAIDHAALQAKATHSLSFAHAVLLSLSIAPIEGVVVIASCRTERRDLARGDATCRRFEVPPLSEPEASAIAQAYYSDVTRVEIADLRARSDNNPRVLVALLKAGRPFDANIVKVSADSRDTLLDTLIWDQFTKASTEAQQRGVASAELHAMLASLAILPPPVPLAELAAAQGLSEAAVRSFASDLHPLVAQSPHGLIFADEPTETLIQRKIQDDAEAREAVVQRLKARQEESNYAARALPAVLTSLNRTDDLIELAFEDRLPHSASSRVAERAIRLSRLMAALIACAHQKRTDDLTRLLLEAARVAGAHERSDHFLQDHPDLVAIGDDAEALRRLFETRASWTGRRHAALSLAYALLDDLNEARRNALRAFDWLNWRSTQTEQHGRLRPPDVSDLDRLGPSYWALLDGRSSAAILWIDRWNEEYAFNLFAQLTSLLERHADISTKAKSLRDNLFRRACGCRLKSRSFFAALLNYASLDPKQTARIVTLLARASSTITPASPTWSHEERRFSFADALLSAAIKAVRLGLHEEARSILDAVALRRPNLAEFDSEVWISNSIQPFLLAQCVRAAIEHRSPTLTDICPEEIDVQIKSLSSRKSAVAFEKAVEALLTLRKVTHRKRRTKATKGFDNGQRENASRTLTHRVRPLILHMSEVTKLIRTASSDTEITSAIDLLAKDASVADNYQYPYRYRPRYISNICFPLLFKTVDAIETLSEKTATKLCNWLVHSPIAQNTNNTTYVVSRLARRKATRSAALSLAQHTSNEISIETDTPSRINAYGSLARAIWLASKSEARAYFKRGLEFADALGSGDYDKITELSEFAAQYDGPPLPPAVTHSFARICELNLPEEAEKFAWVAFGQAMSRISGPGALAIVARLADRGKIDLSYSLPPLLTALVKDQRLTPELAGALIGLDEPVETWSWRLADFLDAILPRASQDRREAIVDFVLCEMDRQYRGSPPRETMNLIATVTEKYVPKECACQKRILEITSQVNIDSRSSVSPVDVAPLRVPDTSPDALLARIDTSDPAAIDSMIGDKTANGSHRRLPVPSLRALGEPIRGVEEQRRFLEAVCETKIPSLVDKLMAINELVSKWRTQSAAISDALPDLAKQLAARHVLELIDSDWDSSYGLRSLIEFSGRSGQELIPAMIVALGERAQFVGGIAWLRFATVMAKVSTAGAVQSALSHFISKSVTAVPQDVGDGPWNVKLTAPGSDVEIVAGLLWARLGSPSAPERWRAAHAIRRLIRLGRNDILGDLVARLNSAGAGAFQDQALPFFFLHAQLWLFIALSRIAVDVPELAIPFRTALETAAFDQKFPHVLIRHFAGRALSSIAQTLPAPEGQNLLNSLRQLNLSPFPRAKGLRHHISGLYDSRPPEHPKPANEFHFDYDFAKYELNDVARVFGLPQWQIEDSCTAWIRKWSPDVTNMYSDARGKTRFDDRSESWSSASQPSRDRWGGCLAWHALMLTVGQFLKTTPVLGYSHQDDPWQEWMNKQDLSGPEGLWLADGTDPFPLDVNRYFKPTESGQDWVPTDPATLGTIVGLTKAPSLDKDLVVEGYWRAADGIDVSVRSAIVTECEAMNVALTVALGEPFHRYLPHEDNYGSYDKDSVTAKLIQSWTASAPDSSMQLETHDPYCSSTALHRSRPSDDLIRKFGLRSEDPFRRGWSAKTGETVFRAGAWGSKRGRGQYETENAGNRLSCRADFLIPLLAEKKSQIVLLITAQKYLEKRREDGSGTFRTENVDCTHFSEGHRQIRAPHPKACSRGSREPFTI